MGARKGFMIIAIVLALVASAVALNVFQRSREKEILTIFHAGSLSKPFSELEKEFEEIFPNVDAQREAAGSVESIRKVTDLGRQADVIASSDCELIESMMVHSNPRYANFTIQFASNEMVIAYSGKSPYDEQLTSSNWFEILGRKDVNFGFGNPNLDPAGYRSLIAIQLAELYYDNSTIFEDLIERNTAITSSYDNVNDSYTIFVPDDIAPLQKIWIMSKETDLLGVLESGDLHYLIIYKSVAKQHEASGISYLQLPKDINLSDSTLKSLYGKVRVTLYSDLPSKSRIVEGKPILYGATIPLNAKKYDLAVEFLKLLLGLDGQEIMKRNAQQPIVPAKTEDITAVPEELHTLVVEI